MTSRDTTPAAQTPAASGSSAAGGQTAGKPPGTGADNNVVAATTATGVTSVTDPHLRSSYRHSSPGTISTPRR